DLPPDGEPPESTTLHHESPESSSTSNPWHPFKHHAQYQLADFLFWQNETPQHQIDDLMDIWAAMPEWGGHPPPFTSHSDVLEKIDSITGDPVWECLSVQCTDATTTSDDPLAMPAWKQASYDVWFRAPEALADFQLANPEFKSHIDYSPKQVFGDKHECIWSNFMTGNWAWRQCVSYYVLIHATSTSTSTY
ncbi:hypothetical protein SCLCIDRAFT_126167, partial [Scleroderma citrinum Foug A]